MKLLATITPTDIISDSFKPDDGGAEIEFHKVQFLATETKKVGELYRDFETVELFKATAEAIKSLEVGVEATVEVSVKAIKPKSGGFPFVEHRILRIAS